MEPSPKPKNIIEVVAKAIRRKSVLSFTYDGVEQLVVEPIVLGIHKETGKHVVRCYKSYPPQIWDKADNWYLCELDKITDVKTPPVRAKNFRKGCKTLTGDMSEIIEASADYEKLGLLKNPKK